MENKLSERQFLSKRPKKNGPTDALVHIHNRNKISIADVISLIEKRFESRKLSTTYVDLREHFGITKKRAQRILKICLTKRLLIAPQNKKPQEYYPYNRRFEVTEHINKKNVPVDTTGTKSPISLALEQSKASEFLDSLLLARHISRQIHKLQLELTIDNKKLLDKDYYDAFSTKEWPQNRGKALEEFIDERKVTFAYYRNGKIAIWVMCSEKPFNIETEDDILTLSSFLGQVRDRLEYQISDPRGRLVTPITLWTLKQCDLSKDVPISDKAQMTLPDIQLSTAFGVFRLYVKNLKGQPYYRCEDSRSVNDSIRALKSLINPNEDLEKKIDNLTAKIESLISSENTQSKVSQSVATNSALELGPNDDNTTDSGLEK
jgi:hypothetical protein